MQLLKNKITRNAILFTLFILFVYRMGSYIVTPLVNANILLQDTSFGTSIFNLLSGGSMQFLTLFALGVSPYITSSIVIQLLESDLVPAMAEWKHQGVSGQNKRSAWTKYLAIIFAFVQALGITLGLYAYRYQDLSLLESFPGTTNVGMTEFLTVALIMTAGSTILMWLADRITEKGVGNGMSVIIMSGILAKMPSELKAIFESINAAIYNGQKGIMQAEFWTTFLMWLLILIIFLLLVIVIVYYTLAYRKVDINYVKSSNIKLKEKSYIPIKLNPAGVIPVIFVAPLMQLPLLVLRLNTFSSNGVGPYETVIRAFFDVNGQYWYVALALYFILIMLFSVMYSYIQMNPETMSDNLEKQSAYIVGIRPGKATEKYLSDIITSTTIIGGLILAIIAVLPIFLQNTLPIPTGVNLQLIGTGLIITINVIVQTYQSMTNKIESKTYKKLFN